MKENKLAIVGGILLDGKGGDPLEKPCLLVENEKIMEVGEAERLKIPNGFQVIDATGLTVMPGIIDAHVHFLGLREVLGTASGGLSSPYVQILCAANDARETILAGVTTVADLGSPYSLELKKAINMGEVVGPRFIASGRALTQTAGHGDPRGMPLEWVRGGRVGGIFYTIICDGIDEVRRTVREQIRTGADIIKFMASGACLDDSPAACRPDEQNYSFEEMQVICEEAHRSRRKAAVHAETFQSIKEVIRAGVDMVEHGFLLDEEVCDLMIKRNVALMPTLGVLKNEIRTPETPEHSVRLAKEWLNRASQSARMAYEKGVRIGVGSDTFGPPVTRYGDDTLWEIELMVEVIGMKPMEAIVASTKTNAEALGVSESIGTVEKGKLADIVILKGNPLDNIGVFSDKSNILWVIKEGKVYKKPA